MGIYPPGDHYPGQKICSVPLDEGANARLGWGQVLQVTFNCRNSVHSEISGNLRSARARTRAWTAVAIALAAVALYACGSNEDPKGDDAGKGGATSTGGTANAGGDLGAGGASTSSGGATSAAGASHTTFAGGSTALAGAAGTSVVAGAPGVAGSSGVVEFWDDGIKGVALDATNDDRLWAVTFGRDGAIYAAGSITAASGDRQMVVAKYTQQGTLDSSFGSAGVASLNLSTYVGAADDPATEANDPDPSVEEARDLVVQSDGKIVVVGRAEAPTEASQTRASLADLVFFRLNADGTRDTSFGDPSFDGTPLDGLLIVSLGATPEDQVWGLDIDATDRLYAFASGRAADTARTDADRYVVRLTANGTLDTSFAGTGLATFDVPLSSLTGSAPATLALNDNPRHGYVLSDGSVIASGYTNVGGRNQIVLAKFTSAGVLDTTFSGDGVARVAPFANGMAEAYGVATQYEAGIPAGFVTTGYGRIDVESTSSTDVELVGIRLKANGEFDNTFAAGGVFVQDLSGAEDRGRYVMALPDNRILMAGAGVATGNNKDAMLVLLERNGAVASNFDPAGPKLYDFGSSNEEFYATALSKDGKWVAAVGYAAATSGGLSNGNATVVILPVGR